MDGTGAVITQDEKEALEREISALRGQVALLERNNRIFSDRERTELKQVRVIYYHALSTYPRRNMRSSCIFYIDIQYQYPISMFAWTKMGLSLCFFDAHIWLQCFSLWYLHYGRVFIATNI